MSPRDAARLLGISRIAVGLGLLVWPRVVSSTWVGRPVFKANARVLARAVGIRDVVMGAGILAALSGRGSPKPWLAAATLADATDIAITLADSDSLPGTAVPSVIAGGGAGTALGVYALTGADDS